MTVINTKEWLEEYGEDLYHLCDKLVPYFQGYSKKDIYQYLTLFGMHKPSLFRNGEHINHFVKANHWKTVNKMYTRLRKKWKGPDVPIIILPVNEKQKKIMKEYKGKAGIAFPDKLFLFLALDTNEDEIKALLTHEYHHVCRLKTEGKNEENITLLDSIVMEGLAEHAVNKECGERYLSYWTKLYSNEELTSWWNNIIYPSRNVKKADKRYNELLYGLGQYPEMLGYCIGYYIIALCMELDKYSLSYCEKLTSEEIGNIVQGHLKNSDL